MKNTVSRRDFIKVSALASGSLILSFSIPGKSKLAFAKGPVNLATHYFEITSDNKFIFIMDKAEMGQGVITGQTTMFGEEADIDPHRFLVRTAPVDEIYATTQGMQITGGSTSTKERWQVLRQAGANLRQLILKAAASKWSQDIKSLRTEDGMVISSSGQRANYADFIQDVKKISLSSDAPLKKNSDFRYIGKSDLTLVDSKDKSTGKADYGIDFKYPDLKVAVVVRSPNFGGKLAFYDSSPVKKQAGVIDVIPISSGVAIVCEKYWQALKARKELSANWKDGEKLNTTDLKARYLKKFQSTSGKEFMQEGDTESAFKAADKVIEAEYDLPYSSHSPMEPMNAAAYVKDGKCEIWSPNQGPTIIRNAAARFLGVSRDKVTVHTTKYLGGGFGRRSTIDYSMEAVEVAAKLKRPVKVIWSREDDTMHSPMRPFTAHKMKAAIKGGQATAWKHQLGCESIMQQVMPRWAPLMMPEWLPSFVGDIARKGANFWLNFTSHAPTVAEGAHIPYAIPNKHGTRYELNLNIPIHFWRSVGHSYNGFVKESFIDEVAHAANQDPYEFRRNLMPPNSRERKVLEMVAEKAQWQKGLVANRYQGIAVHHSFASYVAQVAEVEVENNQIAVKKVYCVVDCGMAVNPEVVRMQMESGIIYGLSAALKNKIDIVNGVVQQKNFDTYAPLRLNETPEIIVHIMESDKGPTGVGEPGLPPIAAAVSNAVFVATKKRLRSLPLQLS